MPKGQTLGMGELETVENRPFETAPFAKGAIAANEKRDDIVVLTADLGKYTDVYPFRDRFPDRFYNVGMAEQALVTVAAGLSRTGWTAYCTTYGAFATRRAHDFLAIACAHGGANVKMFAGNPGLTTGYGGTHQAIEDLALMRAVPDMTVIDPCDATEMRQIAEQAGEIDGTVYCRLLRGNVPVVFDPAAYKFELGKAKRFGDGADIGFISTGFMTERCLDAARDLARMGVKASVLHCATIKPFDRDGVAEFAASVDKVVTAENHVLIGGLTSVVLDALQEASILKPMLKIGIPDRFIECGSIPYLQNKYGLTAERVRDAVADWLGVRAEAAE
jgi:transketolase